MKVDFFIVGEPKSGTTALASFLSKHPDICMAKPKEPGYFATDFLKESDEYRGSEWHTFVRSEEEYKNHFKHCSGEIKGEASTNYLYSKEAAKNIKKHNPDAKIIIMLRNPVGFMHSLHMQFVNEAREDEADFAEALKLQKDRKQGKKLPKNAIAPSYYQYEDWASYSEQVQRYKELFEDNQIMIIGFEDFLSDNEKYYKQIIKFLNQDESFVPEFKTVHGSKIPRSKRLNKSLNNPRMKKTLLNLVGQDNYYKIRDPIAKLVMKEQARQPMDPKLKAELFSKFEEEIKRTSSVTGIDFTKKWTN